jgi:hypothetical protein
MRKISCCSLVYCAGLVTLLCTFPAQNARASLSDKGRLVTGFAAAAAAEYTRFIQMTSSARAVVLATRPAAESPRRARPLGAARADRPVVTAAAAGTGQAGYVHYFLIRMPDETLEVQVGVELSDQQIAWSFPELGVVVSPFIESGVVSAGGKDYEVWHLYGIRPFPDDAAMAGLQKALPDRVRSWVEGKTPYCDNDGPRSTCMSCLGFVLRVLFPGRNSAYPDLPRDFWRAGTASRYTTRDLLLYLTGMLELPTREARLQRIARLALPDDLRDDLEALVYSMGATESAAAASTGSPASSARKRADERAAKTGHRAAQRRRL